MSLSGKVKIRVSDLIELIEQRKATYIEQVVAKNTDFVERFKVWRAKKLADLDDQKTNLGNINYASQDSLDAYYSKYKDYSMPQKEQEKTAGFDADLNALRMATDDEITVGTSQGSYNNYF